LLQILLTFEFVHVIRSLSNDRDQIAALTGMRCRLQNLDRLAERIGKSWRRCAISIPWRLASLTTGATITNRLSRIGSLIRCSPRSFMP